MRLIKSPAISVMPGISTRLSCPRCRIGLEHGKTWCPRCVAKLRLVPLSVSYAEWNGKELNEFIKKKLYTEHHVKRGTRNFLSAYTFNEGVYALIVSLPKNHTVPSCQEVLEMMKDVCSVHSSIEQEMYSLLEKAKNHRGCIDWRYVPEIIQKIFRESKACQNHQQDEAFIFYCWW